MAVRLRFTSDDDLVLLKEVLAANPFGNPDKWKLIHENVVKLSSKNFSVRSLKDHTDHLLKLFQRNDKSNIKKSGTEEQYIEKQQLLQNICDLRSEMQIVAQKEKEQQKKSGEHKRLSVPILATQQTNNQEQDTFMEFESDESADSPNEPDERQTETSEHNVNNSSSVLGPDRHRKKRVPVKNSTWQFLTYRRESDVQLREKEIALEEKKVALEEKKLVLEERRLALEELRLKQQREEFEHARKQQIEELNYRRSQSEQQQKIIEALLNHCLQKKTDSS